MVVSIRFRSRHDGLDLLDNFTGGVDVVVALFKVGHESVIELHIDVIEVVLALPLPLECTELLEGSLGGLDGSQGVVRSAGSLAGAVLNLSQEVGDEFVQRHPLLLGFLLCFGFLPPLLGGTSLGQDDRVDDLTHFFFGGRSLTLERRIQTLLDLIHLGCQSRIGVAEITQSGGTLL